MKFFRLMLHLGLGALYLVISSPATSQDTLTVMYYNVLNYPGSTSYRVSYFRTTCHYVMPDVLLINELISDAGAELLLNSGLNAWGVQKYQKAEFTDGPDTDNMLFYNSDKLTLYSQDTIPTGLRFINEYVLYYNSPELEFGADTIFLYFYSAHLKASTTVANRNQRRDEVMAFKDQIAAKGYPDNVFFGGDMNFYNAFNEPGYDSVVNSPIYSLVDPLPAGNWHDNPDFAYLHTQSTRTDQFGGGAKGGLDDRFDFIFFSPDVSTGENGVAYVPESCIAFGNDGLHLNMSLLDPPENLSVPDSVNTALYYMSDHLPVLCLIEIRPTAKMDIKVFIEGAFDGDSMTSGLTSSFPSDQPYDQPPWFFNDPATVKLSNPDDIIDWCIVELRITQGDAESAVTTLPSFAQACVIMKDGSVLNPETGKLPWFFDSIPGNKFVVIRHRNHLDIISLNPMSKNNGVYNYDFTESSDKVLGGMSGYSELGSGYWGMAAGDTDGNGVINLLDLTDQWNPQAGKQGYHMGDVNLDEQVTNFDKNEFILKNLNKLSPLSF
jgi:hypothetical protein